MDFEFRPTDALIVIDPQNDFTPGGALAVTGGDEIMRIINATAGAARAMSATVVVTQDWHPEAHMSFAKHWKQDPFTTAQMPYGEQTLWPDHCVQGSPGADFHPAIALTVQRADLIIRKGTNRQIDSYSAFLENDKTTPTGLSGYLKSRGITRCVFVGLAYDFCVGYSALDAVMYGFEAVILKDLTRAIAMPINDTNTASLIEEKFEKANVIVTEYLPEVA